MKKVGSLSAHGLLFLPLFSIKERKGPLPRAGKSAGYIKAIRKSRKTWLASLMP